ncbi:MAG: hypothetical protein ACLP5H_16820 [Desulfomonilaceae bacterium]
MSSGHCVFTRDFRSSSFTNIAGDCPAHRGPYLANVMFRNSKIEFCQHFAQEIRQHDRFVTSRVCGPGSVNCKDAFTTVVPLPSSLERIGLMFRNTWDYCGIKSAERMCPRGRSQDELLEIFTIVLDRLDSLAKVMLIPDEPVLAHLKFQGEGLTQRRKDARFVNSEGLAAIICRLHRAMA